MRTICELSLLPGAVYVSLPTREAQTLFLQDAQNQGVAFPDGSLPTDRAPWNFYRLGPDLTLDYAGRGFCTVLRMQMVCHGAIPGEITVDYLRYRSGEKDYILPCGD